MTDKPSLSYSLTKKDRDFMLLALHLGRRGLGGVAPNPAVGCVIAKQGKIIGRGWTQPGGRPHAETEALLQAGTEARGAKVYVTLEPCAHHGQTGPCAEALIQAGVIEVHIALKDPDARVAGRGIEMLESAGIVVILYEDEINTLAAELNTGFLTLQNLKRPMVTLKIATDQNGMMRTPPGHASQLTGTLAQRRMHLMRAEHDVILVGRGTLEADNPSLSCRLPGLVSQSPLPAVATSQKTLQGDYILSGHKDLILLNDNSPMNMLKVLGERGVTRVLLEGGPRLARAFLAEDCVDEIVHFKTTSGLEDTTWPPEQSDLQLMGIENMSEQTKYFQVRVEIWPTDITNHVEVKDTQDSVFFYRRVKTQY